MGKVKKGDRDLNRRLAAGFVAVACVSVLFAPAFAQTGWQADWQKALEASRTEGKVMVGVPPSAVLRVEFEKVFGERFKGIQLELAPGPATTLASKIVSEQKAGIKNFDLFIAGAGVQLEIAAEGVVDPVAPYMILPEVKDPKNWFGGHIWVDNVTTKRYVYPFQAYMTEPGYYNTGLLNPTEIVSYDNLLDAKWKGKIGIHDPRIRGSGGAVWAYLWRTKGEGYLKKLAGQDLLVSRDLRQLADLLAKGRLALVLGVGYAVVRPFMEAGLPVKALRAPNEGIHASSGFGALTVMKNPPHPNATKVFANWLLGKEGQEVYGRAMGSATRRLDVDTKWLEGIGIQAAKDFLTIEEYIQRESFLEDRAAQRQPPIDLAEKLLK